MTQDSKTPSGFRVGIEIPCRDRDTNMGFLKGIPSWDIKMGYQLGIPRQDTMSGYHDRISSHDTKSGYQDATSPVCVAPMPQHIRTPST